MLYCMEFETEDQIVRDALAADERLRDALHDHDVDAAERLYAPEFTLNSPATRVQTRQQTIDFVASRQMRQVGVTRDIEAAYRSGPDVVVIMGYESFVWEGTGSDFDGRPTARRFTNVWRFIDGRWQHIARQATTIPVRE
jgi:Domain of unknown function (DUF4440)